ncbi:MAG TPA: hypothetical protein VMV83_17535 [Rectinemataceae bacterium]|nr:hypothetical protein [Rectinemataceae bacterium]
MSLETRQRLLAAVFPELKYGDDPDIDRYLELRKDGRIADALAVYNGALRGRYPTDTDRATLIALKRSRDPRWVELQRRLLDSLAARLEIRLGKNISTIVQAAAPTGSRDAWSSLKAVNALLSSLGSPDSVEVAISTLQRHIKLARVLAEAADQWKQLVKGLEYSLRLLEEYAALATQENSAEQDFVARSRKLEEKRRAGSRPRSSAAYSDESTDFVARSRTRQRDAKEARPSRFFDLDRIRFTKAEIAAIEIANPPKRLEDLVVAWCAKYWRLALDPRFEKSVFLYSSKYRTRHFEIFRELRLARLSRRSDDEMLTGMSSLLSTGYAYSVSGDLYMQRRWRAVKAGLFGEVLTPGAEIEKLVVEASPPPTDRAIEQPARGEKPKLRRASSSALAPARPRESEKAVPSLERRSSGSISDRIRRLSGRQYDVYRNIFLEKVRASIHRILLATRTRQRGIFDTSANEAEDALFGFILAHYDDPFMDWETSRERALVESLGFPMPRLDGIIEDCYRRL